MKEHYHVALHSILCPTRIQLTELLGYRFTACSTPRAARRRLSSQSRMTEFALEIPIGEAGPFFDALTQLKVRKTIGIQDMRRRAGWVEQDIAERVNSESTDVVSIETSRGSDLELSKGG